MTTLETSNTIPETTGPASVALWNPNVATLWSLLFTPVFGAWLHALNWRALGDTEQERKSMAWVYGGGAMLVLYLLIDGTVPNNAGDGVERFIEFVFLVAWYFGAARAQARLVKAQYGKSFVHKPWRRPLLMAVGGFAIYVLLTILIAAVIGIRYI